MKYEYSLNATHTLSKSMDNESMCGSTTHRKCDKCVFKSLQFASSVALENLWNCTFMRENVCRWLSTLFIVSTMSCMLKKSIHEICDNFDSLRIYAIFLTLCKKAHQL